MFLQSSQASRNILYRITRTRRAKRASRSTLASGLGGLGHLSRLKPSQKPTKPSKNSEQQPFKTPHKLNHQPLTHTKYYALNPKHKCSSLEAKPQPGTRKTVCGVESNSLKKGGKGVVTCACIITLSLLAGGGCTLTILRSQRTGLTNDKAPIFAATAGTTLKP